MPSWIEPRCQRQKRMPSLTHIGAHPAQTALLPWRARHLAKAVHVLQAREIAA